MSNLMEAALCIYIAEVRIFKAYMNLTFLEDFEILICGKVYEISILIRICCHMRINFFYEERSIT